MQRWAGLLALVLAASGCALPGPPAPSAAAAQPAIVVPPGWSGAALGAAGGRAVGSERLATWWQRFDDPLMSALVGRALSSNTSVLGAQAALRQARSLRDVAAAALLPTVGAVASVKNGSSGGESTGNRFDLGLDAQWVPDAFGARSDALDAGHATAAASAASLGDVQVRVAADVVLSYVLLRALQARWRIANDNLANQLEVWQITDWRQQAGLVSALEVEQAYAAATQTQALLPGLQTSIDQAAHALAVLVGQPPAALLADLKTRGAPVAPMLADQAPAAVPPMPTLEDAVVPSIPADVLRQRADVRAAEYQVAAALARVGQAQAQRWPSFAIGGSIGLSAISAAALTNGASVLSSVLASVSLPVFDGGALRAQVRAEQAALAQSQALYRAAVLGALKDVEDALVALHGDRQRLASLSVAAQAAGNAALMARQRYSSGLIDFQTVLATQRNQLLTQDSVVSARADVSGDQVRLFTALGGGWRMADNPSKAPQAPPR